MQAFPILGLELFQRLQPDREMLPDALAIDFASHAGELDFTMGGVSETQGRVPYGTRKRKPLAAIAVDSMSSAIARDCDRRRMMAGSPISQLRLSTLATVPVRITRFSSKPARPITSPTANSSATCISANAGIGAHRGSSASRT